MSAPHARVLPLERAAGAVARHPLRRYRLKALRARSPLGAPLAALAAQINATAQPRPRFARTGGCGRYPHHRTRSQRCTSRAGHSAGRSMPKLPGSGVTKPARRNRTRSVSRRHRMTSLTMNGMDAVIQIRNGAVKGFSIYADKTRGCAARLPLHASPDAFHSTLKIRKSEVVPVNQGFLCCANLFAAARRRPNCTATRRARPRERGDPLWIPACAGMSGAARRMG